MNTEETQKTHESLQDIRRLQAIEGLVLTDEQQNAVDQILNFFTVDKSPRKEFHLGGYAGTGKTTVIKTIVRALEALDFCVKVCAFTGKACNVLTRKNVYAQTLHSLMYQVSEDPKTRQLVFTKRGTLDGNPDYIIVDEASMLSTDLYNDLSSYRIKVLYVGDPGQLEPVGDNPNLMAKCDIVLSKIHRQAEKSPIIQLASVIRRGGSLPMIQSSPELTIRFKGTLTPQDLVVVDQVIVGTNKLRTEYNTKIRMLKGLPHKSIAVGEKIIVLRNNLSFGVFNGMILFIDSIDKDGYDYWQCSCHDEVGNKFSRLPLWKDALTDPFFDPKAGDRIPKERVWFDYGYVITCHKSQGSEWPHVLVIDQSMPPKIWDNARWRYTSITRASQRLTYCK